ncbi:non-ribosomal peptide synthetase [Streptomyces sedi]|uniref:Amino acid adenylation domain-containing protein n=1 Tax=Streptomyces sedi TaxID=555059 RepID=A0A5C4VFD8_9ACTN|nr:non-ribosomal peptide synthetase [Streptomyces sedi]TNM34305.1 amino acid adenylation domain-containing protein [Streptomyces sedi]
MPLPEDGKLPTAPVLAVAMALLTHRYTGFDRVDVDVLDGPETLSVALTEEATTADLVAGLADAPRAGRQPAPLALSFAVGPDDAAYAGRELVLRVDTETSRGTLSFDATVFDAPYADQAAGHYRALLKRMTSSPHTPVALLDILTPDEADTMLRAWNATDAHLTEDVCLHQVFEERAALEPAAVAVVCGTDAWTFDTVNRRANALAHRLIALGVGPDVTVGIRLEKSPELLTAILGVLKAGGAYVPLDPGYPEDRLEAMLLGTGCAVLIGGPEGDLSAQVRHHLSVKDLEAPCGAHETENPATAVRPDNLCYVIHTSGSTGAPKPIALCHRGVLNNLADLNARHGVGSDDAVLALSSPGFDMSVYEFLGITLAGGTVVIPETTAGYHPASWWELIHRHRVTVWNTAPPLIELFLDFAEAAGSARPLPLRLCMTGGDWVPATMPERFRAIAPNLRFVALGGATEASIHSTAHEWRPGGWNGGHLPYGRPLANQRTYILDESMMPVPVGVPGELYLAGVGLARGYLDRPEQTDERFVQWSHDGHRPERLYRTGDMARFWPGGLIEILGRRDFQVKINGIRVELGEIESTLAAYPGVRRAVVVSRPAPDGRPAMVAWVTAERGRRLEQAPLFDALRARLPRHMVPGAIEIVSALPLNPNGKVDRRALGAMEPGRTPSPPPTPTPGPEGAGGWYGLVLDAWRDVLGVPLRGHDDFFENGGDSMKAIRSMVRIDRRLRVSDIYRHPTAAALTDHLTNRYGTRPDASCPESPDLRS